MTTSSFEAVLVTGATETPYRRAGTGAPVILLFPDGDPLGARLFDGLAARFRVIAPVVPSEVGFSKWLRDLIDGLGLDRPALVVGEALAGAALELAVVELERVRGVVTGVDSGDPAGDVAAAAAAIVSLLEAPARRA